MSPFPLLFLVLISFSCTAQAKVPDSKTFNFLIEGLFQGLLEDSQLYFVDVGVSNHPFALCIYGADPNYESNVNDMTLALRLDTRLVWQANTGKPVHKNSSLAFGRDGNLVLADADGGVVWQTNTANKGVVDLQLLPDGNMVLVDKSGKFVWQSFDHPTDSILVGQSLLPGERNKLVSRVSVFDNRDGPFSLVIDGERIVFYYKRKSSPKREIYSLMKSFFLTGGVLAKMTLATVFASSDPYLYHILLSFLVGDSAWSLQAAELKYNATYSFLQLGSDGNLRIFTYYDRMGYGGNKWETTFTLFSRIPFLENECQLPTRCGDFGVCEDNQCVACPSPKGLLGWSKRCSPPKLPRNCNGAENIDYYKIVGMDHFSSPYSGEGPMGVAECQESCSGDCKCLGYFYNEDTSTCLITSQLNTLTRVSNSSHLAFIKFAKQDRPVSRCSVPKCWIITLRQPNDLRDDLYGTKGLRRRKWLSLVLDTRRLRIRMNV